MLKRLSFLLILLLPFNAYAYKETFNSHTGRLDKVGADSASDISSNLCSDGQILKKNAGVWGCAADDSTAGGGTIRVSEDGTFIASADTLNFTTGIKAVASGVKVTVSGDMATATTPGIASFDTSNFSIRSFGGVFIKNVSGDAVSVDTSTFEVLTGLTAQEVFDETDQALLKARNTGVLYGGIVSADGGIGTGTNISVTAGEGGIIDLTIPSSPNYTKVTWGASSAVAVASSGANYFYIDSSGNLQQTTTAPTNEQYRTRIWLAQVSVTGGVITAIANNSSPLTNVVASLHDFSDAIGPIRVSGAVPQASGANLKLKISSGEFYDFGVTRWTAPNAPNTPLPPVFDTGVASTFRYITTSGVITTDYTDVRVGNYQVAGVETAIPGASSRVGIHYVVGFPSGNTRLVYGTDYYANFTDALEAVGNNNPYDAMPGTVNSSNSFVLGAILATKGATDLSNSSQATFVVTNRFGQFGGGAAAVSGSGYLQAANNLSDLTDASQARSSLGLGALAVLNTPTVRVSEDGAAVTSADTVNFTTGLKATTSASGKATVSGDMATTTTPGIASFDTNNFSVRADGGVSVKTGGIGSTELASTTVVAGSYTNSDLTVDADGRITTISNGSSSGGYSTIQEEGVSETQRGTINFIGTGVLALDNAGNSRTNVSVKAMPLVIGATFASSSATRYSAPYGSVIDATQSNVNFFKVPYPCTGRNLNFAFNTAAGANKQWRGTVWKNGASLDFSCVAADPATSCVNTSRDVAFVSNDTVSFEAERGGAASAAGNMSWSFECVGAP